MFYLRASTKDTHASADGHGSMTDHQEIPVHPLRITFVVIGAMVGSVVTLATAMMVTTALAAITGATTTLPGLITATPGAGSALATASTGAATTAWFVAVTLALVAAELLVIRRRRTQHERRDDTANRPC